VGGDSGVSGVAKYTNGVIVYVGAQKGLMAGGSVGLQMFKYKSVADANSEYDYVPIVQNLAHDSLHTHALA
jgi:hypothetical protein